jgi:hypothetical protein
MTYRGWILLIPLALACLTPATFAKDKDYDDEDFSVRLPSAFVRFMQVSAMGGQTAANRWSSAINPATTDWVDVPSELGIVLAPYFSHVRLSEGTRLNIFGEAGKWDTGLLGTFQPSLAQVRSNDEEDKNGLTFDYETDNYQIVWGKRFGDIALGVNLSHADTEVERETNGVRVVDNRTSTNRYRFGGLYEIVPGLLSGLVFEYGISRYDTDALQFTQFGPFSVNVRDTQRQVIVRGALSYEYEEYSTVALDSQWAKYTTNQDRLKVWRVTAGVQHRVLEWLFLRGGGGVDDRGNVTLSAGASAHYSTWGTVELGYHYNPLPELRPDFGRSHIFEVVLSFRF